MHCQIQVSTKLLSATCTDITMIIMIPTKPHMEDKEAARAGNNGHLSYKVIITQQ